MILTFFCAKKSDPNQPGIMVSFSSKIKNHTTIDKPANIHNVNLNQRTIIFTIIYSGVEYQVQTYENEYFSLMNLISVHLGITGFGLCSGMGSCGTCFVEICGKMPASKKTVLACGINIDDELSNVEIRVHEPAY
ncbi:hypothetical protein BH11BAC3_BH11BAC3_17250 [soil metagenome]